MIDLISEIVRSTIEKIHAALIGFGPWDRLSIRIKGWLHGPRHDGKEPIATVNPTIAQTEARTESKVEIRGARWETERHRLSAELTTNFIKIKNSILRLKRREGILSSRLSDCKRKNDGLEPPNESGTGEQIGFWVLTIFATLAEYPLVKVALAFLPLVDWETTALAFVVTIGSLILCHWVGMSLKEKGRAPIETLLTIFAVAALFALITAGAILRGKVMRRQQTQPQVEPEVQIYRLGGSYDV